MGTVTYKTQHFESQSLKGSLLPSKGCQDLLEFISDRNLIGPALVLLELYRPLAGLGDALYIFAQPFLKAFSLQQSLLVVLRDRSNIDWLIQELDIAQRAQVKSAE